MGESNKLTNIQGLLKNIYNNPKIKKSTTYKAPHAPKSSFSLLKKILQK